MLPKYKLKKDYILDKMHRGFVNVCMGVTLITGVLIGYKAYEYFRYIRPLRKTLSLKVQEELLAEGRYLEETASKATS